MKCYRCGTTIGLEKINANYRCTSCSEKIRPYLNLDKLFKAAGGDEWNQKAKEINGKLMAKYAK